MRAPASTHFILLSHMLNPKRKSKVSMIATSSSIAGLLKGFISPDHHWVLCRWKENTKEHLSSIFAASSYNARDVPPTESMVATT